ncbi:MAG: phosphatase PAP2 family protein [Roseovarius sp.]
MKISQFSGLLRQARHNVEMTFVVILSVIVATTWALSELVDEVIEGATSDIDRDILLMLRSTEDLSDPIGPWWLEEMGRDLTALGGVAALTLMTLVVSVFFLLLRRWTTTIYILVSVGGGILISSFAKEFFDRSRPDLVPHGSLVHSASFPSGHSMMAAVAFLTMGVLIARVQPRFHLKVYVMSVAVLLTVLVGVSRVYLGVHWPTDVAAGWLAGGAWAMVCLIFARNLSDGGHLKRGRAKYASVGTSETRTDLSPDG